MKGSQVSRLGSSSRRFPVWFCGLMFSCALALAGTNVPVVVSLSELVTRVDVAFTNAVMARIILPGIGTYTNDLDIVAYSEGFDSDFLAALPVITNQGLAFRPVEVREPTNTPRQRFYLSSAGVAVHTTTVSLANYPTNWVVSTYGACPSWVTGAARTQWFAERDPSRQRVCLSLISTSDVPVWLAAVTNVGHSLPGPGTNMTFLDAYSNDIALAGIAASDGLGLLLHAPSNTAALDLYTSTNLMDAAGWRLYATLEHAADPLLFDWYGAEPGIFFTAGDPGLDTDNDGLADVKEFFLTRTDPTLPDTVGDGLGDFARIMTYGLSANNPDSDGDGLSDAYEIATGLNPQSGDSDGDGLSDYAEVVTYYGHVCPTNSDTDRDGLNDYAEIVTYCTYAAPYIADGNPAADTDNDGLTETQETTYATNPRSVDSDGDGMDDKFEIDAGLNPLNPSDANQDKDNDGFSNLTECEWKTDPCVSNGYSTSYYLVTVGPGTNGIRRKVSGVFSTECLLAMADLGSSTSLIRVPPRRSGTNMCERRLAHEGTAGFRIDGVPAPSVSSPIIIPASSSATVFRITVDPGYAGAMNRFELQDSNGVKQTTVRVYSPKTTWADFFAPDDSSVRVNYGQEGTLWYAMPADTNASRIHMFPTTSPSSTSFRSLEYTDWILARVYGPGATPSTATLNELDWRSAYAFGTTERRTRGIQLVPGVHSVQVGIDANADSILETNEVHTSCKVYVPKIDLTVDSDNDGTITTNDNVVEDALPGKVIWADKDLYWRTGTNDSDVVEIKTTFDMGGQTVPDACYLILQWFGDTNTTDNIVDVFLDSACTTLLTRTGWHPAYSNTCRVGHLFDVGDIVPDKVYLRASTNALGAAGSVSYSTYATKNMSLRCYRRDTKAVVMTDTVNTCVANRPAVTPKRQEFWLWSEERTTTNELVFMTNMTAAVTNDLTGNAQHIPPYRVRTYRISETNMTPANFANLGQAGILITSIHGSTSGGYVFPVAFPYTPEGQSNALDWAIALGWGDAIVDPGTNPPCYFVKVRTSYFTSNWKPQRDANEAMFFALTCFSATPNPPLPSYISSVGGAFALGSLSNMYASTDSTNHFNFLKAMRTANWRTAYSQFDDMYSGSSVYRMTGHGKVTLWPGLLKIKYGAQAYYPTTWTAGGSGTAIVLFDTVMREDTGGLMKLSGDAHMDLAGPQWLLSNGQRCGLRWNYTKDAQTPKTKLRIVPDRCIADPLLPDQLKKFFSGDGVSCGKDTQWEF